MPVKYECDICFKVFSHKSHYNSHLKRMTPCIPNSSISPNILENIQTILMEHYLFFIK